MLYEQIERNNRIEQQLAQVTQLLSQRPTEPKVPEPQFTDVDFSTRPAEVISTLIKHSVSSAVDNLRNDINKQLTPVNQFIQSTQQQSFAQQVVGQLKGDPRFPRLREPAVEQQFMSLIANAQNLNEQGIKAAYYMAVGYVSDSGMGNVPSSNPSVPPYVPPNSPPAPNSAPALPPLDENQLKIAKQRGWSHARAAYANGMISAQQYLKLEPNGKLIEGL